MTNEQKAALNIAEKTTFLNNNYQYLRNVSISEWDIKHAGLSVLKFRKVLPQDMIEAFEKMEKHERTVKEGLLQKDRPEVAATIIETLAEIRKDFVLENEITEFNILSIKKDAIFLINKKPEKSLIKDEFQFVEKNKYTSYICLSGREFYYNSFSNVLDTKGINSQAAQLQEDFILKDFRNFLKSAEKVTPTMMYQLLKSYRSKYLSRELPIETYRELDTGKYRIGEYLLDNCADNLKNEIDITQNYMGYILPLIQMML